MFTDKPPAQADMDDLSSSADSDVAIVARELARLQLVQCDRTLMGIPDELLTTILDNVVGDETVVTCRKDKNNKKLLSWTESWVPGLLLVSKKFDDTAKEVIARHAKLQFVNLNISSSDPEEDGKGVLNLAGFPTYLCNEASELHIVQAKVYSDQLDVSAFLKLRKIMLRAGDFEDWPKRFTWQLVRSVSRTAAGGTLVTKFDDLVTIFADPSVLSPGDSQHLVERCRACFTRWLEMVMDHSDDDMVGKLSRFSSWHEAFRLRLHAGQESAAALIQRMCELDMGINRSRIIGLMDHTTLDVIFTTETGEEQEVVSRT
jgi:hypothetical protein